MLYIWDTQFLTVFIFTGEFIDYTDNIISFKHTLLNQRSTSATNAAETVMLEWGW